MPNLNPSGASNDNCTECDNGKYRPSPRRGAVYWLLFICGGFLFPAVLSLVSKRRFTCPVCGRLYD